MKCFKKIEILNCGSRAVKIANKTAEVVDLISYSTWWKKRKELGVTEAEMSEMINRILGNLITEKVNYMILHEIVINHGSKKMIDAYTEYKKVSVGALEYNLEKLVSEANEKSRRNDKKEI